MPGSRRVAALAGLLLWGASGCVELKLGRTSDPDEDVFTAPTQDGSRYVSVEGGALSTPKTLVRRWKSAASDVCRGDYIVLSDAAFERRQLGVVTRRVHEGFVSCVETVE